MSQPPTGRRLGNRSRLSLRYLLALVLLLALSLPAVSPIPLAAQRPSGAGLVIRHGDGRVVVYYVEFPEPEITGLELLIRSGASVTLANFGGLGAAVCAIDGEGCPAENCFCQSYTSPAFYWHYYRLDASGSWVLQQLGPSSRRIRDGDVDGWAWTSGESGLPPTSIDEIAAQFGVDRMAAATPLTAQPTRTPPPLASPTAAPIAASTPSPEPPGGLGATRTPGPVSETPTLATPSPRPTRAASAAPTTIPYAEARSATRVAVSSPPPVAGGVATPGRVPTSAGATPGRDTYAPFGAMLVLALGLAGWLAWRRGTGPPKGDGS